MKKIKLLLLGFFLTIPLFSQVGVGFTSTKIKNKYNENYTNDLIIKDTIMYNKIILKVFTKDFGIFYIFNKKKDICNFAILTPNSLEYLKNIISSLNKNYIIIDDKHWKKYTSKGIIDVELIYDNNYFFNLELNAQN